MYPLLDVYVYLHMFMGFPGASVVKNLPVNAGDTGDAGLIPGLGRCLGGGHGNPLQYSCLENPMDRGAWWATVHRVAKSRIQLKQLSTHLYVYGLCKWFSGKESTCQCSRHRRHKFDPWVEKIPWRRSWQPIQYSCLEIPWTEEPGGLHSMGSQRAGHDWVTEHVHRSTISGKVLTSSSSRKDCFVCFQDRCSLIVKISAS